MLQREAIANILGTELKCHSIEEKTEYLIVESEQLLKGADPFNLVKCLDIIIQKAVAELKYIGCYQSCRTGNMEYMYNGIFQENRLRLASEASWHMSMDHGGNFIVAILAAAGNDYALIKKMFPQSLGYAENCYYRPMANMLMAILYGDEKLAKRTETDAAKWMAHKQTRFERCIVEYLSALWRKETDRLCSLVEEIIRLERKNTELQYTIPKGGNFTLEKTISMFAHGLFSLAEYYLEPSEFARVGMPDERGFLKEYEQYRRLKAPGRPLITFQGDISFLNEVILILPEVSLKEEAGRRYQNSEAFRHSLYAELERLGYLPRIYRKKDIAWTALYDTHSEFLSRYHIGDAKKLYYGRSLLYYALSNENLEARYKNAEFLLKEKISVAPVRGEFDGPFHYLFRQKKHDISQTVSLCEKLLKAGADPNLAGAKNILPVECIMQMNYSEEELQPLYDLWMSLPVLNLELRTFSGERPVDIAVKTGRRILAEKLRIRSEKPTEKLSPYEQLDKQIGEYNWDCGFVFPEKVLSDKICDLALALKIFYLADGFRYLENKEENCEKTSAWCQFIEKLYTDITNGKYRKSEVHYKIPLTKVQKYKLSKKNVPKVFLEDNE